MNEQTPKPKSVKDILKERFMAGDILTSCDTAAKFHTADLRQYITQLRRSGMNIVDEWITSENGKRFKKYWLKKEQQIIPGQQTTLAI